MSQQLDTEIDKLKGLAIGAAMGAVRDLIRESVPPSVWGELSQVIDSATTKLGGRPLPGPVLHRGHEQDMRGGEAVCNDFAMQS